MTQKLYIGSNYGHNSSFAVINNDGYIVFAIEEERYTRIKATDQFPESAFIEFTKKELHLIQGWSEGWSVHRRFFYKGVIRTLFYGLSNIKHNRNSFKETKRYINWFKYSNKWKKKLNITNINYVGHHYAHALSLLPWGLKSNSLVLVSDTTSERESISLFMHYEGRMTLMSSSQFPNSIGSLFHQMAYHLGYTGRTGPGKLMALSAYGKPIWYSAMKELVKVVDGNFSISKNYPRNKISGTWLKYAKKHCENTAFKNELISKHMTKYSGRDLACSIQKLFEESTYELIQQGFDLVKQETGGYPESVGMAGGSALNCQANGKIKRRLYEDFNIKELIVSPWSDDSGTAIGAAVHQYRIHHQNKNLKINRTSFLGTGSHTATARTQNQDIANTVSLLLKSEIVSLYDTKMEFGPRALGARCIIARADDEKIKERLNLLKDRPFFMPFAPVILEEDFNSLFLGQGSINMAWTVPFTNKGKEILKGAQHPSNEARVQIVTSTCECYLLREMLKEIKRKTGYGVLLLTSLNGKNEPIARNLEDAISTSKNLGVKYIMTQKGLLN